MGVGLVDITAKRAALTPHAVAFEDVLSGRTLTYAQLEDCAARCANVLSDLGIGAGDRVAILCRNRIEFFEILFGCAKLGAILTPLNWRMPPAELSALLADCTPKLLIYGREDAGVAAALQHGGLRLLALDAKDGYAALRDAAPPLKRTRAWRDDEIWTLLYTSGTTGTPKAVIQTYQMTLVNYVNAGQAFGICAGDCTLNFLPLFHTAGIQLLTLPTLMAGGAVLVLPSFQVDVVMALLAARRLDTLFGVPTVYQELAAHPAFDTTAFNHVRAWACGGAPLSDVLVERFASKGVRICNGYGMTETGPTAFVAAPEDSLVKIGSVGKPQMLLDVRVVGANGEDVADGETGEIWMRGPGVTPGYWRRPEANFETFTADGWLKSGDLGRRDAEGCYYISGRIKDMYISGGENVFPAEVENVLARYPAVLEAAVVGVADDRWGEVGRAFIVLKPGASKPDPADVIAHCRRLLASYKVPRTMVFVDDLPHTPTGKVRKHLLNVEGRSAS